MLLNTLIQNQQSIYTDIQVQIDNLQEKQREIQAFLQKLGSVESQMLSATQMVAEAIASISEVCPDELDNYQATINSLFGDAPVASLNSGFDSEPQVAESTPPVDPQPSDQADIEVKAEVVVDPKPEETGLSVIKINGVKERQEVVEQILKVYFTRVKTQEDVKNYGVPTTEKQVKVFLRNKIEDVTKPINFEGDSQDWQTELFMQATKMETTGKDFWIAVNSILLWLQTV